MTDMCGLEKIGLNCSIACFIPDCLPDGRRVRGGRLGTSLNQSFSTDVKPL